MSLLLRSAVVFIVCACVRRLVVAPLVQRIDASRTTQLAERERAVLHFWLLALAASPLACLLALRASCSAEASVVSLADAPARMWSLALVLGHTAFDVWLWVEQRALFGHASVQWSHAVHHFVAAVCIVAVAARDRRELTLPTAFQVLHQGSTPLVALRNVLQITAWHRTRAFRGVYAASHVALLPSFTVCHLGVNAWTWLFLWQHQLELRDDCVAALFATGVAVLTLLGAMWWYALASALARSLHRQRR